MTGLLCLSEAYYLPKDDEYYQFCYIDQDGMVRGASVPFQFRAETEDDILVVTTQVCVSLPLLFPAFAFIGICSLLSWRDSVNQMLIWNSADLDSIPGFATHLSPKFGQPFSN